MKGACRASPRNRHRWLTRGDIGNPTWVGARNIQGGRWQVPARVTPGWMSRAWSLTHNHRASPKRHAIVQSPKDHKSNRHGSKLGLFLLSS
jgi:hypothetical protein